MTPDQFEIRRRYALAILTGMASSGRLERSDFYSLVREIWSIAETFAEYEAQLRKGETNPRVPPPTGSDVTPLPRK